MGNYIEFEEGSRDYDRPATSVIPKIEIFGPEKVSDFLSQTLETSDTNGDGRLSRIEFDASQKNINTPLDKQTSEFVSKHFGAISILSSDGIFSEGGISSADISTVRYTDALGQARKSYTQTYGDVGGKVGAVAGTLGGLALQGADFVFTGGAATFVSTVGHFGLAAVAPFVTTGRIPPLGQLSVMTAGMIWGPLYGGAGGYEGGKFAGDRLASNYFNRKHEPQIKAMLQELNPDRSSDKDQRKDSLDKDSLESMFQTGGQLGEPSKPEVTKSDLELEKRKSAPDRELIYDDLHNRFLDEIYRGRIPQKNE